MLLDWEASHDPLTGLPNRRRFREHLDAAMRQAEREQAPLFLVILDIDHFKLYNDHYGHASGDAVLQQFAQLLQRYAQRPLDLAVRLGGEELGLVIYGMEAEQLAQHLEQLQSALQTQAIEHRASPTAPCVTVSMGAALLCATETADQAFQRADALLYQAKHLGRNQMCMQPLALQKRTYPA